MATWWMIPMVATAATAVADPTAAVAALLERQMPGLSGHFELTIDSAGGSGCFSIDDVSDLPGHHIVVVAPEAATLAAGGTLGILIPPSVILVIYAILTEQNIAKLFLSAFIPGILAAIGYMITIAIYVRVNPSAAGLRAPIPMSERFRALSPVADGFRTGGHVHGVIYIGVRPDPIAIGGRLGGRRHRRIEVRHDDGASERACRPGQRHAQHIAIAKVHVPVVGFRKHYLIHSGHLRPASRV